MSIEKQSTEILKSFFGFNSFKGKQKESINSILEGKDALVVMPTGGGKSLCYQIPSLILEGTSIIISPLIALMKNQVDSIRSNAKNDSIAHFFNSTLTENEKLKVIKDVKSKKTKILYVAPETICNPNNIKIFKEINISFFAIDEAHCISEWGHDFRPEYKKIRSAINSLKRTPIMALTATATKKVQDEIKRNLGILEADFYLSSFNRKNLFYKVIPKKEDAEKSIIQYIKSNENKSGIIYCRTRKKVDELTNLLTLNNIDALPYHAGLDKNIRNINQEKFLNGEIDLVVATIAFGMGIDKPNIRFVIHLDIPKSIESYYQETGRAGRDGGYSECLLYFSIEDFKKFDKLIEKSNSQKISKKLINEVLVYSSIQNCRREFILNYFDEKFSKKSREKICCDNCSYNKIEVEEKEKLIELLNFCASKDYKISDFINVIEKEKIENRSTIIAKSISDNLLVRTENQNLKLTEKGKGFINNPSSFLIPLKNEIKNIVREEKTDLPNSELLQSLILLRKKISEKNKIPPFVIFQDSMLESMCKNYPTSNEELSNINGISKGKAEKYGELFISKILEFVEKNSIRKNKNFKIKSNIIKPSLKVFMIQQIDKKTAFEDIANIKKISFEDVINEIEKIIESGTKLNIDYQIDNILSDDDQEELYEYYLNEAEDDSIESAKKYFEESYEEIELRIMRIKFLSDLAN
tara:strand:- start:427 stop:2517 length:2091 start_codon:yes stop_codon:yes gene_type:complete